MSGWKNSFVPSFFFWFGPYRERCICVSM